MKSPLKLNIKLIISACSLFIICNTLYAEADTLPLPIKDPAYLVASELKHLDLLILATERSLESQKQLRAYIVDYQDAHDMFMKNPNDNDLLFNVVKAAHKTLKSIKDNNLTQNFDSDFIEELSVLAKPAKKRGIPK